MSIYYLTKNSWKRLLSGLTETCDIYVLKECNGSLSYELLVKESLSSDEIVFGGVRAVQSVKSFFHLYAEDVSKVKSQPRKRIIVGVKACDLTALAVMDKMFMEGDCVDPFYKMKRDNTVIITSDCTKPNNYCFCTLLGNKPYSEKGFDLNISQSKDGFIVEVGSDKGKALVDGNRSIFGGEAKENLNEDRVKSREKVLEKVKQINAEFNLKAGFWNDLSKKHNSPGWKTESEMCVECGACTNVCPSCYCFLLADIPGKDDFSRMKYQDSCQYSGYARVAGGASPRPEIHERFRNRYLCKYEYRPASLDLVACTGCGRCIEACQGKIDKRKVLAGILKK